MLAKDDPRRVVIKEMAIVTEENGTRSTKSVTNLTFTGTTTHKLDNKEQLEKLKDTPFILKGDFVRITHLISVYRGMSL